MRGSAETLLAKAKSHRSGATMFKASLKASTQASTTLNLANILLLNISWVSLRK